MKGAKVIARERGIIRSVTEHYKRKNTKELAYKVLSLSGYNLTLSVTVGKN